MALTNSVAGYGTLTKLLHWMIVILFAAQYFGGHIMTYIGFNSSFAGRWCREFGGNLKLA